MSNPNGFMAKYFSWIPRTDLTLMREGVTIAVDAIRANKARAALTILGVAVGVFVVVVISAAIHGINTSVAKDIEAAGPNSFMIQRFPISFETCDGTENTCKWLRNPPVRPREVEAVSQLPSVQSVTMQVDSRAPVAYRGRNFSSIAIQGATANWVTLGGNLTAGRSFTESENANATRIAVVNSKAAEEIFGLLDPIDKIITINGAAFRVIGVFHYAASFLTGGDAAKIMIPLETAQRVLGLDMQMLSATVRPYPDAPRDVVLDEVTAELRLLRRLKPGVDNTFALLTQDQLFDTYNKIFGMFFVVMLVLSAVGLLVGGVGVIAIMLISVTERTREIGVRKALGATRRTILWQFLVEAVTLTGIGAAAGLIVGWMLSLLIRAATPIPASIPPNALLMALGASAVTGVAFGMFPALRASRLDPVEALRHE